MSKLLAGRTFDYVLDGETFKLAVLSGLQSSEIDQLIADYKSEDHSVKLSSLKAMTALAIKGGPYDGDPMETLTRHECWLLIGAAIEGSALTADERKKFGLRLNSETD